MTVIKNYLLQIADKESPLAIVCAVFLINVSLFGYIDRWTSLPMKVSGHTEKIKHIRKQTKQNTIQIKRIKGRTSDIRENQRIMICNDPDIGDYWKNKKNCGEFK